MKMKKVLNAVCQPWKIVAHPAIRKYENWMPAEIYLRCFYRTLMGEKLNLKSPQKYSEKLQWLKLYNRKPIYTDMVDKWAAKKFVAEKIGEEHIIKTYGVWDSFDEIDFASLPDRFVLKCTHDSAGLVICKNKSDFRMEDARNKISACLGRNFYYSGREWPYKNIKPRVLAEEYMEDHALHELRDYKLFTFNGVPKIMHLVSNRQNVTEETYGDFFDMDFNRLDLTMGHPNAPICPEKPCNFEKMKEFAAILAEGTIHLRVDFYEVDGDFFFGELTFFQDSGFTDIQPSSWNQILGDWIELPKNYSCL